MNSQQIDAELAEYRQKLNAVKEQKRLEKERRDNELIDQLLIAFLKKFKETGESRIELPGPQIITITEYQAIRQKLHDRMKAIGYRVGTFSARPTTGNDFTFEVYADV